MATPSRLVIAVSYVKYATNKEKHQEIAEHKALGWLFKADTGRGLCFYMLRG